MEDSKENVKEQGGKKRKVKVINDPYKKKPLRTPTQILRLAVVWSFIICIFLLTFPFLSGTVYMTDNLGTTLDRSEAHLTLASQEEIDDAAEQLKAALSGLKKRDDTAEEQSSYQIKSLATANYNWRYHVADEGLEYKELRELIQKAMDTDLTKYTEETVKTLNTATLNAQKTLCATVQISQTAIQMMLGGSISEAYGHKTGTMGITQSLFAFTLGIVPIVGFFAASFDKHRNIKHIICLVAAILCLSDIILMIYPYVGIGAVLSIIMYFIICILNIVGIYAKQQEDYIIKHPELEAEFTQKHPHFVKALINEKTFGKEAKAPSPKAREYAAAKNAKRKNKRRK